MMGVDGYMKSVLKTVPPELNFNAIAGALKNAYDIDMDYITHVEGDQYIFTLSKGSLKLRFTILRYEYEDNVYEQIIRMNVDSFLKELEHKNALYTEDELLKAATHEVSTMTLPNPWLTEELNMTKAVVGFDKTDRDRILHIKKLFRDLYSLAFVSSEDISYIAGGAFTSLWYNEVPRDIDLFFINNTEGFNILNNPRFKVTPSEYMSNPNIKKVVLDAETNIQYIYTNYASREQLINHFDMMHCCVSYDFKENKLYISPAVLDAIKHKAIKPNGKNKIKDWRLDKMMRKGWTMVPE